MSQTNPLEQLNAQLAAANAALEEVLENGGDSSAQRYQISVIEAEIAAAVRLQREKMAEAIVLPRRLCSSLHRWRILSNPQFCLSLPDATIFG